MVKRKIKLIECTSVGKMSGKNDDDIYVGENFAAVIDGVSSKSIAIDEKSKIAGIITEAIRKIDRPSAPEYAKTLEFEEFVRYINMYIKKYCERIDHNLEVKPLEATGIIYSKYHNQLWLVGDCRAIYDGQILTNELQIDDVYKNMRIEIIQSLLRLGYTPDEIKATDIEKRIIENPEVISEYIKDPNEANMIKERMNQLLFEALLSSGFTKEEISSRNLLQKYSNPKKMQNYLKNNSNVGYFGYSVFNGIETNIDNCRIANLPDNVKRITMTSDGIPIEISKKSKDLGQTIRAIRRLAISDPLSIGKNAGVKSAVLQSKREPYLAVDDASAICIEIEYEKKRDDEDRDEH